ncbi:MAG: hypothetical protein AAGB12_09335 [Pseudomonadota bacterium]
MVYKLIFESKLSVFLFTIGTIASLIIGWIYRKEYWLTPETGWGYWFGIIGGVMMLVLLLYPARKKFKSLRGVLLIKYWFQWHMIFGIVGPVLILYHCNFQLGATNSNVALISMILVVVSGLFGRYIYRQYSEELHDSEINFKKMREKYNQEKKMIKKSPYLSENIKLSLEAMEQLIDDKDDSVTNQVRILRTMKAASKNVMKAIQQEIRMAKRMGAQAPAVRQLMILRKHIKTETEILQKMAKYALFSHLFSIWHILHFPLFIMLIIAAIIHVIAVHMY